MVVTYLQLAGQSLKHRFKIALLLLNFLCFFFSPLTAGQVIIIMGASCSGKSTLSKEFLETLEGKWQFVELDKIEEDFTMTSKDFTEIELVQEVVNQANYFLKQGYNIIIDTNMYHEILRTISTKNKIFILIHCPLNILLERNIQRDRILQRSTQRAIRAKQYVEKTFHNFENFKEYDILVDYSSSACLKDTAMNELKKFIYSRDNLHKCSDKEISVYAKASSGTPLNLII